MRPPCRPMFRRCPGPVSLFTTLCLLTFLVVGCGGNPTTPTSPSSPVPGESTTVAIQISSTANGQFVEFPMRIDSISLTNKAAKTTTIFNTPTNVEFIVANGEASPFVTVTVPQDVYTSAAVGVSYPAFDTTFINSQGGIDFNIDEYGYTPTPPVVILSEPITISGSVMGMTLNLQASQSGSFTGLPPNQTAFTINPTFDLTAFAIPTQSTTPQNGKCIGITGRVTAVDSANSIAVTLASNGLVASSPSTANGAVTLPISLSATLNSATQFQGISSASSLTPGVFVNMDVALEPNGSYVATRVEVQDAAATNVASGGFAQVDPSYNYISQMVTRQQGDALTPYPEGMGAPYVYASSTKFQTSARFPNLSTLPFTAVFNASSLAAGQDVSVGSTFISESGGTYSSASTVTLIPQTIDATITAVSNSGNYTIYAVTLAPYDPIVQMNSPQDAPAATLLPGANVVMVYIDSDTALLNAAVPGVGGTFRFNGLLFNDKGVLRMVCDQVNDGVPQ
jgi:hypothetical protein